MPESFDLPLSKLRRSSIAGMTAAKVGVKHLRYKSQGWFLDKQAKAEAKLAHEKKIGELLFSVLSQLRGTALKVSQILSMEADILPETIRAQLKNACYKVPPINKALVRKQLVQELGAPPAELFKGFNLEAFAAASIGQVHRAITLEDQLVAVKIQYPGIGSTIQSDLKIIEKLFWTIAKTTQFLPEKNVLDLMMREMQARLMEEIDYENEAENLTYFKQHVHLKNIVIPSIIDNLSAKRVLTMEMLDGLHIDDWLATHPSQATRNHIGQLLFDFFWYSFFQLNKINADLHPGNFLFLPDGQLGVLDFGCVRNLDEEFVVNFSKMLPVLVDTYFNNAGSVELFKAYQDLKFIDQSTDIEDFNTAIIPNLKIYAQWFGEVYAVEQFDFNNKSPCPGRPSVESQQAVKLLKGMYSEQLCFDRAHLGLMNLLTQIGGVVNTDWKKFKAV